MLRLENTFARLHGLSVPWRGAVVPRPRLLLFNRALAAELGLPAELESGAGARFLCGMDLPEGLNPVAQAYAGHQFGHFVSQLGDGRALLLGEVVDPAGQRRDLHLKGSGPTPFARGGDGKAVLGPMLREYVMGEAMHALGIPTTRALAVVATGEAVLREGPRPGAVLARVAASHLRVGTFQYAAVHQGPEGVRRLADYAIRRHDPDLVEHENPYLALLERVIERQVALVTRWMLVGFVHGVMNTDNTTLSGETIDYGPCAFMEAHDPKTVFSSIDVLGRYAYGEQPGIIQWNLARLAETLVPLIDPNDPRRAVELASERIHAIPERQQALWRAGLREKLGLTTQAPGDEALAEDFLELLRRGRVDHTLGFRALADVAEGRTARLRGLFPAHVPVGGWLARWRERLAREPGGTASRAQVLRRVSPLYIPRNHKVEEALAAAEAGDLGPIERLLEAVTRPFDERPGLEDHAEPAPEDFGPYRTTCGT